MRNNEAREAQLTWLREGHDISHVSHENSALELKLGVLVPDLRS